MNISGVRPTEEFYKYNTVRINELRSKQILASQNQNEQEDIKVVMEESLPVDTKEGLSSNVAMSEYEQNQYTGDRDTFKGEDSDIHSLDMQKAVSDLKKDEVLQEYQYFISSSKIESQDKMGPVERIFHSEENFAL